MNISTRDWHGVSLNEDQLAVLQLVRDFCNKEIRPQGPKYHKSQEVPWDILKKAAKAGIYSPEFFEELFKDQTGKTAVLGIEELFCADAGIALALFATGLPWAAIFMNGTDKQQKEWLPKCFGTEDDPKIAAFACSESHAGSDIGDMRTTAVYDGESDTWTLNGTKDWISNGGKADVHVVQASVDRALGSRGQACFIVPPGTKGLSQGSKHDKLGFRASHTAELLLDKVVVPGDCLLGGKDALDKRLAKARLNEKSGGNSAMATFGATRWMVAAMSLGIARAAFEHALEYATERQQFGKPIVEHQQVAKMLADMATEIYVARCAVLDSAHTFLTTLQLPLAQGAMAKYFATEMAVRVTTNAVQVLGGAGYVYDHPVGQWLLDSLLPRIFEGTSQIQVLDIATTIARQHNKAIRVR